MITLHPQYITNNKGKKLSAILPMKEFKIILEELEDLEDIKLFDAAKSANEPSYPIDEAFKRIEAARKKAK